MNEVNLILKDDVTAIISTDKEMPILNIGSLEEEYRQFYTKNMGKLVYFTCRREANRIYKLLKGKKFNVVKTVIGGNDMFDENDSIYFHRIGRKR